MAKAKKKTKKKAVKKVVTKATKKAVKKTAKKAAKKTVKKTAGKKKAIAKKVSAVKPKVAKVIPHSAIVSDVEYLMGLMDANGIAEVNIEDGKRKISVKKHGGVVAAAPMPAALPMLPASTSPAAPVAAAPVDVEVKADNLLEITSPIVGTFYSAPSPESDAFVKDGDRINGETVVCIVEAMKVMNEIKAECKGTIVEICIENAEPVEFGQVMFRVKPE